MISPDQLKLWKEAAEKATPGEWTAVSSLPAWAVAAAKVDIVTATGREYRIGRLSRMHGCEERDARFIALSREAVPQLIAEVERLQDTLRKIAIQKTVREIEDELGHAFHCGLDYAHRTIIAEARAALAGSEG